jgi:hypothetical protein
MLTHDPHNFLMHDLQAWYKVLPEHQDNANKTLWRACQKLTHHQFDDRKHTSMNHYLDEKLGKTMTKHELITDPPPMLLNDFVLVNKSSMCF